MMVGFLKIFWNFLYGELLWGKGYIGVLYLCYKNVCKKDMKVMGIDINFYDVIL